MGPNPVDTALAKKFWKAPSAGKQMAMVCQDTRYPDGGVASPKDNSTQCYLLQYPHISSSENSATATDSLTMTNSTYNDVSGEYVECDYAHVIISQPVFQVRPNHF
jgi:hypothetical protein